MQIIHIIPGSGGSFYCGNCLRDSKYVDALRSMGNEVIKVPMYLPLFSDEHDLNSIPVFYGAISIYLKQLWPVFQRAPRWFDRLLNSKPALKLAAGMAGSTRAKGLEELTVSMLLGEEGQQKEELDKMVDWIKEHCKPDIVHLSNALLLGLAHRMKEKLNVPVVCSLQDEDIWVDVMHPEVRREVWKLMSEKAAYVDAFISVSGFFSKIMKQRMNLPDEKLHRLHLGIDPLDYDYRPVSEKPDNIGFISRMCPENGLDILIDAFIQLSKDHRAANTKLVITGGHTGDDSRYLKKQKRKLRNAGLLRKVDFHKDFEGEGRKQFFEKISVLSVPVRNGEAFGLYLLESLVSGIPVVQPHLGAFPEIVSISGGGTTYEPNTPGKLAAALIDVLYDAKRLNELSDRGRKSVIEDFDIQEKAMEMIGIYEGVVQEGVSSESPDGRPGRGRLGRREESPGG